MQLYVGNKNLEREPRMLGCFGLIHLSRQKKIKNIFGRVFFYWYENAYRYPKQSASFIKHWNLKKIN